MSTTRTRYTQQGMRQPTTSGPVRPPLLNPPARISQDMAYWVAWLAYVAHGAMVVTRYTTQFRFHTIDMEYGRTQTIEYYWALATWECMNTYQLDTDNHWDRLHILIGTGKMASMLDENAHKLESNLQQHIVESRHRFPQVWEGIPVHDSSILPQVVERLKKPFTTYEEAIAVTKGKPAVYQRRLLDGEVGWPKGEEWSMLLQWPQSCPTCGSGPGVRCTTSSGRDVARHQKRPPPLRAK